MTVQAQIQFGSNRGAVVLDDAAKNGFKVTWDGRTPLLWRRVQNEVEEQLALREAPQFGTDQVRITGARDNRMDILDAWSMGRYLNLVWQSAKDRGLDMAAKSDAFKITFRIPRSDADEELTGPQT